MLGRGWGGSAATAVSVAGVGSAAQLGLAYGLGIVAWNPSVDTATGGAWLAGLAWITWIAASSTLLGAAVADRLAGGRAGGAPPHQTGEPTRDTSASRHPATNLTWRVILAVSAAAGGLLTVPLAALPASAVHRPQAYAPQGVAAGYALVGVVLGVLAALAALSARAVALNLVVTSAWLWLLAIVAVVDGVAGGREVGSTQIAVWRFGPADWAIRDTLLISDVLLMLGSAVVIGALCAWWPARRGDSRVAVAVSGATGPLLVAAAYFLAAPRFTDTTGSAELSPYLIAPYAVIAGLAGSVLAAALSDRHLGWWGAVRPAGPVASPAAAARPDGTDPAGSGDAATDPQEPETARAIGSPARRRVPRPRRTPRTPAAAPQDPPAPQDPAAPQDPPASEAAPRP